MREVASRLALAAGSLLLLLVGVEICLRVFVPESTPDPEDPPVFRRLDSPVVYGLNPEHPGVSPQGFYDDPLPLARQPGRARILLLGDSIAFGVGVDRDRAFPQTLERLLAQRVGPVDVINAAVPGYTPWNEFQDYLERGRRFAADAVIVAFCLNDVANPRLHWGYTRDEIRVVPEGAIPNAEYDRTHVLPALERRRAGFHPWESRVARALRARVWRLRQRIATPTMLTGEDSLPIDVLLDDTPEWRWLTGLYQQLADAIAADGATPVFVLFPVAYQLDPGYPHRPLDRLMAWCDARGLACLDLLDRFEGRAAEDLYLLDRSGFYDVWHLNEAGHDAAASAIAAFVAERVPSVAAAAGGSAGGGPP